MKGHRNSVDNAEAPSSGDVKPSNKSGSQMPSSYKQAQQQPHAPASGQDAGSVSHSRQNTSIVDTEPTVPQILPKISSKAKLAAMEQVETSEGRRSSQKKIKLASPSSRNKSIVESGEMSPIDIIA